MMGESQAARRARLFDQDWDRYHEDFLTQYAKTGDARGLAKVKAALAGFLAMEDRPDVANPMVALLETAAADLIAEMTDAGFDADRLGTAHLLVTSRNDISAETRPFDDGSALIAVSDSLVSLCAFYCRCVGLALGRISKGGFLRRIVSTLRAALKEDLGLEASTIAGMLRYYHVQQRVYGLSGMLAFEVSGEADDFSALLATQSTRFVVGHELVHHALGHDSALSGFHPGEHLPVCSDDQQREHQADIGAHLALVRLCEKEIGDAKAGGVVALWGALAAVLAVYSTEKALFVRSGATHPPALDRVQVLLGQVEQSVRGPIQMFLGALVEATDAATVFGEGAVLFDGEQVLASPLINTPLKPSYLKQVAMFDALMCHPHDKLLEGVTRLDLATPRLAEGARLAAAGRAADALDRWGVEPDVAQRLLDPARPLAFHTLRMAMKKAFTDLCVDHDSILASSVVAATLLEPSLRTP